MQLTSLYIAVIITVFVIMLRYYLGKRRILEKEKEMLMIRQSALKNRYGQMETALKLAGEYREEIRKMMEDFPDADDHDPADAFMEEDSLSGVKCGNVLIQTVLRQKTAECRKNAVALKMEMEGIDDLKAGDVDLTAVFFNILDNAVEACCRIPDPGGRWITAKGAPEKNMWHLTVENACLPPDPERNGRRTWKPDEENHGYGLMILDELAGSIGGRVRTEQNENRYHTDLWLPIRKR